MLLRAVFANEDLHTMFLAVLVFVTNGATLCTHREMFSVSAFPQYNSVFFFFEVATYSNQSIVSIYIFFSFLIFLVNG